MLKIYCAKCKDKYEEYVPKPEEVMFCGESDFICDTCDEEGWYSTRGAGGDPELINDKTGEIIPQEF